MYCYFILSIYQFIPYHTMQFHLVTSKTRSLTTFLKCWGQVCIVFCVQIPVTLFAERTPASLINLGSLLREILIARLLYPYTWGLPNHSYERVSSGPSRSPSSRISPGGLASLRRWLSRPACRSPRPTPTRARARARAGALAAARAIMVVDNHGALLTDAGVVHAHVAGLV